MNLAENLAEHVRACFTGIWIQSHEHEDALLEIARLCQEEGWSLASWDICRGMQVAGVAADTPAGGADPLAAINALAGIGDGEQPTLLVLVNFHRFLGSAEIAQAVAGQIHEGKNRRTFLIVFSPVVEIPVELEKSFTVLEHALPDREQLGEIARGVANRRFDSLKASARRRLGSLYNEGDYPATLQGLFDLAWDFPSVEPPDYLRQLNPQVYEEERRRMQARFDEAVAMAEAAFTEELARLVDHLTERLTGGEDNRPKVFRDSAVNNLREFFERFRALNVRSSEDLDHLVARAQGILGSNPPQELRENQGLRQHVATQLSSVQASLDQMLVDRPRRRVLRRAK